MISILLTSCSAGLKRYEALFFTKISKYKNEIKVYGCDNKAGKSSYYEDFFQVPMGDEENYIEEIIHIVRKNLIDFIIPSSDEEAISLSKHKNTLKQHNCIPLCSDYDVLNLINDKAKTYDLCQKNSIPVAKFKLCKNKKDIYHNLLEFNKEYEEFVLKPNNDRGGRGVYIISKKIKEKKLIGRELQITPNEIINNYDEFFIDDNEYIIMEKLYPPCHDVDILCDNGKLIDLIVRKRLNSELPNEGHEIISETKNLKNIKEICKIFKLNFLHDIDFMIDEYGNFKLIEINPRISGSTIISSVLGYKIFDNLIALAQNQYNFEMSSNLGIILPEDLESFYRKI